MVATTTELLKKPIDSLLAFYAEVSAEYDSWLADSYSTIGPGGKPWSEERCKVRARMKTRERFGYIPEELRWVMRARLGSQEPD